MQEDMGCGAAKATQTNDQTEGSANNVPKPVAFEIPVEEEKAGDTADSDSIVKKHPPKRLQRLEEQSQTVLTAKELEEKQQKAEERRLEILEERVNKSRQFQKVFEKGEKGVEETNTEQSAEQPAAKS